MQHSHNDSLAKFHFLNHNKKCQFKHITFDTNLNTLITNPKLLTPLYYTHMNLIGQKPKIKITKTSIASFKIRPNMPIGTHTTIQAKSYQFKSLLNNLRFAFLPGIKRQNQVLDVTSTLWSQNSNSCQISYPVQKSKLLIFFLLFTPLKC